MATSKKLNVVQKLHLLLMTLNLVKSAETCCDQKLNRSDSVIDALLASDSEEELGQVVNMSVGIKKVNEISDKDFSLSLSFECDLTWYDERLTFKPFTRNNKLVDKINPAIDVALEKGKLTSLCRFFFHC